MHHPFTSPKQADMERMLNGDHETMKSLRADAYDLVINGLEVGGGSVRIHDTNMQAAVLKLLGIGEEEAQDKFGFLLTALKYGCPPHAGMAFGLDRLVMILGNIDSIRDVIAFPKTQSAACLLTEAPGLVDNAQLEDLALRFRKPVRGEA